MSSANAKIRRTVAQAIVRYPQGQYSEQAARRAASPRRRFGIFDHGNVAGFGWKVLAHRLGSLTARRGWRLERHTFLGGTWPSTARDVGASKSTAGQENAAPKRTQRSMGERRRERDGLARRGLFPRPAGRLASLTQFLAQGSCT